jgi:hypothetical protein
MTSSHTPPSLAATRGGWAHWHHWLGPVTVVVFFSIIPVTNNYDNRAWFGTIGPFDFYAYLMQHNSVLPFVLPLVAVAPYVLSFTGVLGNRFVAYTRTRRGVRETLARHLTSNFLVTSGTFLVVGLVPQLFVVWGEPHYEPEAYELNTPEAIMAAQLRWKTFSQLLAYGPWTPAVAYSIWLALNAALYATIAMCSVLLISNRVLGLSLPWIGYLLVGFATAVLWLEAYSILLAFPFDLKQIPLTNLLYPLGGLTLVTSILVGTVMAKAPSLPQLQ